MTYKRQDAEFKAKLSNRANEIKAWENQQTRDANARHARTRAAAQAAYANRRAPLSRKLGYLFLAVAILGVGLACGNWFCTLATFIPAVMLAVLGFCKV